MNNEKEPLYDYARGLNAPYWIQEIKTQKGARIWYFATPMQLSFFRSEERRVGKSVDLGGRRIIKKKFF